MKISEASRASGVSVRMIRYYEKIGLINPPSRTGADYRNYQQQDLHMLRFIRRARLLGFAMDQVAELVSLWRDRKRASADVKRIAAAHVQTLRARIAELQEMVTVLEDLAAQCHGDQRPDCPILQGLDNPAKPV